MAAGGGPRLVECSSWTQMSLGLRPRATGRSQQLILVCLGVLTVNGRGGRRPSSQAGGPVKQGKM